jgi:hypothetical protein
MLIRKKGLRHHFRGKENKILNMVQAYATKDRVITVNLSNDLPSADAVRNIPITAFIVSEHTCQVTRFRRVTPGNRTCHPHFPEHPSGHEFHYDDPELVQILEIFIYSENTGILPIERTTIRMGNYNQQQYTFEVSN